MFQMNLERALAAAGNSRQWEYQCGAERFSAHGADDTALLLQALPSLRAVFEARQSPPPTVAQPSNRPLPSSGCPEASIRSAVPQPSAPDQSIPTSGLLIPDEPLEMEHLATDITKGTLHLSELKTLFMANIAAPGKRRKSTVSTANFSIQLVIDVIGDKPFNEVTPKDMARVVTALSAWPIRASDKSAFKGLKGEALVLEGKKHKMTCLGSLTQRKHILYIKDFAHWVIASDGGGEDPTRFINMRAYKRAANKKKKAFTLPELRLLFDRVASSKIKNPVRFWGPRIAYYTGMRVTEVCQLYVDDVIEEVLIDDYGKEVPMVYLDLKEGDEEQRLKSENCMRCVPLHDQLLSQGFMDYVREVRAAGFKHLFPGLPWRENEGPGQALSAWFNGPELRKRCGIDTRLKTLHCFRHTINTLADRSIVPDAVVRTINGHADENTVIGQHYKQRANLLECHQWIHRIQFGDIDFESYSPGRFGPWLRQILSQEARAKRLEEENRNLPPEKHKTIPKVGRPRKLPAM